VRLEADLRQFEKRIKRLVRAVKDLTPVARDFGGHVVRRIKDSFQRQGEASAPGEVPATHRGGRGLAGSVTFNVLPNGEGVEIGTPLTHGEVLHRGTQEALGGPIRPKNAKALTIPISPRARGKRARDFAGIFRVPAGPGSEPEDVGILAIAGSGDSVVPLFALRTAVTIEPRPWLGITDSDEEYLGEALERQFDREAFGRG